MMPQTEFILLVILLLLVLTWLTWEARQNRLDGDEAGEEASAPTTVLSSQEQSELI